MYKYAKLILAVLVCLSLGSCASASFQSHLPTTAQSTRSPVASPSLGGTAHPTATVQPTAAPTPAPQAVRPGIRQISAGDKALYILYEDGTLWAWGSNEDGQIGDGTKENRSGFVKILSGVKRLTCDNKAIKEDGTLWGWGGGQLTPTQLMADILDANGNYFVKTDGTLWAYGSRMHALGDGIVPYQDEKSSKYIQPKDAIKIMADVASIPVAGGTSLAIKKDGTLWIWGFPGELIEFADKKLESAMKGMDVLVPVQILDGTKDAVLMDVMGRQIVVALQKNGTLLHWGYFMDNSDDLYDPPVPRFSIIGRSFEDDTVVDIAGRFVSAFAVLEDGRLMVRGGTSEKAPNGFAEAISSNVFTEVSQGVQSVASGEETLLVLKKDGSLCAAGKACYNPESPNTVGENQVLTPAFHEMWAGAKIPEQTDELPSATPQSTIAPTTTPKSAMDNIRPDLIDSGVFWDSVEVIELYPSKGSGDPIVLFVDDYIDKEAKKQYRHPILDAFTWNVIGYKTSESKDVFVGTDFLPGTYKIGVLTKDFNSYFDHPTKYASKTFHNVSLKGISTYRDLMDFYLKTVPKAAQRLLPLYSNIRRIQKDDFVETVTVQGKEKILFVGMHLDTKYGADYRTLKSKDIISERVIYNFGYNPQTQDLVAAAAQRIMDTADSWETIKYDIRPKDPPKLVPMSKFFKNVKNVPYDTPMTVEELIAFYKANIPQDKQFLLPVLE